jgi:hypothetical protein
MKVLIACEFSGAVRDAFAKRGHNAISCDLLPTEGSTFNHIIRDVRDLLHSGYGWDLIIAFPPCTHLCVSGARWFKGKAWEQQQAILFAEELWRADSHKIAIENPIGVLSTKSRLGKPAQIIQPWQFGHGETKATCLWLKGLPKLAPTNIVDGREARVHRMTPGPNRAKERSRTYQGIAEAMAAQWGGLA